MDQQIKEEWIKRLRSGDYEQGVNYLNKNGKFCCLGVLCEMAAEKGITSKTGSTSFGGTYLYGRKKDLPPYEVIKWAGGIPFSTINRLTAANDIEQRSFSSIADLIEEIL